MGILHQLMTVVMDVGDGCWWWYSDGGGDGDGDGGYGC